MDDVRSIARARNQSYKNGQTADTNYTDDSSGEDIHVQGIVAEYALSILYDEADVDRTVSATGDDGIDCRLELNGELVGVDVKSSSYRNAWLLVKQGYSHEEADAYITSYVDGNHVEFVGYVWADELLQESNLEESPSPYQSHMNYTMKSGFDSMPVPDNTERADY